MKINNAQKKYFFMALNFSSLFILVLSLSSIVQAAIAKDFVDKKITIQVLSNDQSISKMKHEEMHNNNIEHKHSGNDETVIYEQSSWKTDHANWGNTHGIGISNEEVNQIIRKKKSQDNIPIDGDILKMASDEKNRRGERAKKLRKNARKLILQARIDFDKAKNFAKNGKINKVKEQKRIINNAYAKIKKIKKGIDNKEFLTYKKTKKYISNIMNEMKYISRKIDEIIKDTSASRLSKGSVRTGTSDLESMSNSTLTKKPIAGSRKALTLELRYKTNIKVEKDETIRSLKEKDKACTLQKKDNLIYTYSCPGENNNLTLEVDKKIGEKEYIKIKSNFNKTLLGKDNSSLDLSTILNNNNSQSIIEVKMKKKSYPSGFYNENDIIKVPYVDRKTKVKNININIKNCSLSLSLNNNFEIEEQKLEGCWKAVFSWGGEWGDFSPNIKKTQCESNNERGHSNEIVCLVDKQYDKLYDKKLSKYIQKLIVSKKNSTTGKTFEFLPDDFNSTDISTLKRLKDKFGYKYKYAYKTKNGLGESFQWNVDEKIKGIKNIFDNPIPESIVINIGFPDNLTEKCQPIIKTWEHNFFKKNECINNKCINFDDYKPQCKDIKINYSKGIPAEIIKELKVFSIAKVGNVENKEDITNSCNDEKNICQVSNSVANISIKLPFDLIKENAPAKVANEIKISLNNFKIVFPKSLKNALSNSNIYQNIDNIKFCFSKEDCENKTGTVIKNAKRLDDLNISQRIDKLPFGVLISYKNNEECFQEVKGGLILNIPLKKKIRNYASILKTHKPEPIMLPVLLHNNDIPDYFDLMFYENEDRCNKTSSSAPFSYYNNRLSDIKTLPKCIGNSKTFYTNAIGRGRGGLVSLCSKAVINNGQWVINLKRPTIKKPIHFLIVNNKNLKDKVGGKKIFNSFIKSLVKNIHVYRLDDSAGIVEKSQEVLSENSVESLFTYPSENNLINAYKIMRHYITDENYEKLKKINKIYVLTDSMPKEYIKGGEAAKLDNYFNQNNKLQYLSFNCSNAVEKIGVKKSCVEINSLNDVERILNLDLH